MTRGYAKSVLGPPIHDVRTVVEQPFTRTRNGAADDLCTRNGAQGVLRADWSCGVTIGDG